MNKITSKRIVAISKDGRWRTTYKEGWYSLEQRRVGTYVKVNECNCVETLNRWCRDFEIIKI